MLQRLEAFKAALAESDVTETSDARAGVASAQSRGRHTAGDTYLELVESDDEDGRSEDGGPQVEMEIGLGVLDFASQGSRGGADTGSTSDGEGSSEESSCEENGSDGGGDDVWDGPSGIRGGGVSANKLASILPAMPFVPEVAWDGTLDASFESRQDKGIVRLERLN